MKNLIKNMFQKLLGLENYLFYFSLYTYIKLNNNQHEKELLYFIDIIPNDGVILDIGANIGVTTTAFAKRKADAKIFSFEPIKENQTVFRKIIAYHNLKNVTFFPIALGNSSGTLKMVMPVIGNAKMHGLSHVYVEGDEQPWNTGISYTVPVKKADDIPELRTAGKINAIKIDVENFEFEVLTGARELLIANRPYIYCELWANEKRALTINYIKTLQYKVQVMVDGKLVPYTNQDVLNFFFIPNLIL